jgi:hypothetical protein
VTFTDDELMNTTAPPHIVALHSHISLPSTITSVALLHAIPPPLLSAVLVFTTTELTNSVDTFPTKIPPPESPACPRVIVVSVTFRCATAVAEIAPPLLSAEQLDRMQPEIDTRSEDSQQSPAPLPEEAVQLVTFDDEIWREVLLVTKRAPPNVAAVLFTNRESDTLSAMLALHAIAPPLPSVADVAMNSLVVTVTEASDPSTWPTYTPPPAAACVSLNTLPSTCTAVVLLRLHDTNTLPPLPLEEQLANEQLLSCSTIG